MNKLLIFIIICIFCLNFSYATIQDDLKAKTLVYYSFDSVYTDSSPLSRNVNVYTTVQPEFKTGKVGNAVQCNTSITLNVLNNDGKLSGVSARSWNLWVKIISHTSGDNQFGLGDFLGGKERYSFSFDDNLNANSWITFAHEDIAYYSGATYWQGFNMKSSDWSMLTVVINGTNIKTFLNNTLVVDTPRVSSVVSASTTNITICEDPSGNLGGVYLIDELSIFNGSLSYSEISALYNSSYGYNYYATEVSSSIDPNSVFQNAYPNLSIETNVNLNYNVSFNMTNGTSLYRNDSRIFINYSLNGTGDLSNYIINGTEYKGWRNHTPSRINGNIVNFSLDDNDIYFTIANINPEYVETQPHINYDCNATLCLYQTKFKGFSSQPNNYLELDMSFNGLGTVTNLYAIGLCNQENISNVLTSQNCTLLREDFNVTPNHYHTPFGNHSVIGFFYNQSRVNGLYIGSNVWVYTYFANTPTKRYALGVINNRTDYNTFVRVTPLGVTTDLSQYTPDMHIHQNNSRLIYKGCFYDTGNNLRCSNLVTQTIGFLTYVYSNPIILYPNATINNITFSGDNTTYVFWNSPIASNNATLKNFSLYYFTNAYNYTVLNDSDTWNNGFYWNANLGNTSEVHYKLSVCFSDGVCVETISIDIDFLYNEVIDTSTYWLQQINSNVISLGKGVNMLWFIIALLGVSFLPYFFNKIVQRTLLYISIILCGVLIYIVEVLNFFSFDRQTQILFDMFLLGIMVIHIFNLFEME